MTRRAAFVACMAAWLAGCSQPPPPSVLALAVTGSSGQNPGADGAAQPVSVHLYELAATQKFEQADVFALLEKPQPTLGDDLLGHSDFALKPAEKRDVTRDLKQATKAIGVVVLFQKIDQAQWRAVAPVAAKGTTKLALDVGGLSVTLKPSGK